MFNKRNIVRLLIISILFLNSPVDSLADVVESYKLENIEEDNIFTKFFDNLFKVLKKERYNKENKSGELELILNEGEFVPNLRDSVEKYYTIRVTTTGNKKLVKEDYDNLRESGASTIDLSKAKADSISAGAFQNQFDLEYFKFPQGVTIIEESAFKNCQDMRGALVIPETVTTIGRYAFYNCQDLTGDLIIPNSVTSIGDNAFFSCSGFKGRLVIPSSITRIEESTFYACRGFTGDLIIPDSVTYIARSAFSNSKGFNGQLVLPKNIEIINDFTFSGCSGFTGDLIIPSGVKSIGSQAFFECVGFDGRLILPEGLAEISGYAFEGCSGFVGNLVLPSTLNDISGSAFNRCSGFTGDLIIPDGIEEIYSYTFKGCSGFDGILSIPNSVRVIGDKAFEGCTGFIGELRLPNNIEEIEENAFYGCSGFSGNLIIPESIMTIKASAFSGCSNLEGDIIIPDSIISIEENIFEGCNKIDNIYIKVDEMDYSTDYKKRIIDFLPDNKMTVIDIPYDFDVSETWLSSTNKTVGKPIVKNIVEGQEVDIEDGIADKVSLYIPVPFEEEDVVVTKDMLIVELPQKNEDDKYIFDDYGVYNIEITTKLGNVSEISFEIKNTEFAEVEEAIQKAEEIRNPEDIEAARDLVNALPESSKKDEFQGILDAISPNIEFETKNATANLDVYIKSENLLSLSLNTNNITFEDFSGVENMEKLNAITLTVNSSLPYQVNAYLPNEITGSRFGETLDKGIFNIRASGKEYQTFADTETPILLLDNETEGNEKSHNIDLMLKGELAHKKDVYKATIKFEIQQK